MKGNNLKLLTRLVGYSSLALLGLVIRPALAADTGSTAASINLAAISTPAPERNTEAKQLLAKANMYRAGEGVTANPKRAFGYYKRAAQLGLAEAQYQLATMYLESESISQNEDEAIKWLERAAAQGHKNAKFTYNYLLDNVYYVGC